MDNHQNQKENQPARTRMDADGNLQISSSGKRAVPQAPRKPQEQRHAAAPVKAGAPLRRPQKRPGQAKAPMAGEKPKSAVQRPRRTLPARPGTPLQPQTPAVKDGVEYSFANSQLFNNGSAKLSGTASAVVKTDAARAVEQQDGQTKVLDLSKRPRPGAPSKPKAAARPVTGKGYRAKTARPGAAPSTSVRPQTAKTPLPIPAGGPSPAARSESPGPSAEKPALFATKVTSAVKTAPKSKAPRTSRRTSSSSQPPTAMNSVSQAFIYIAAVLLISIILSYIIITNANDIFAFVKSDEEYTITIEPGTNLSKLAGQLKEIGVIEHKLTFQVYIKYRGKDSDAYTPGTYTVSPSMNYDQLISAITPKVQRETIAITVPEGYTVEEIIELFVEKGVGSREKFIDVIQNYDFDYWFMDDMPANADRYYRLEGYLFPDTYYFYTDMSEVTIIQKFLDNFDKKYKEEYKTRAEALGMTTDEVITLASIIQAEGKEKIITLGEGDDSKTYVDYGLISKVFDNRLAINMKLQSDATTLFALVMDKTGQDKVTGSNKNYDNPYNTYNIDGLPPGAICNPGLNAISFALWPDDDATTRQLYYFVSDSKGVSHFSKTLEEHQAITAQINNE